MDLIRQGSTIRARDGSIWIDEVRHPEHMFFRVEHFGVSDNTAAPDGWYLSHRPLEDPSCPPELRRAAEEFYGALDRMRADGGVPPEGN